MRLSEAIRLGSTMKPQGFGDFFRAGHTCAVGAAYDAVGKLQSGMPDGGCWGDAVLALSSFPCPECGRDEQAILDLNSKVGGNAIGVITHLNDYHHWSRERIADWVELHEPLPAVTESQVQEVAL